MNHDVYICCDESDENLSDAVYRLFAENNIKSWSKSRNMQQDDSVDKISNAIADSKCFVLILSQASQNKNYIITETDLAFSNNIPIIVYKTDESKVAGNLEFIIETQIIINSFPNTKTQLEKLVIETSNIIKKPTNNVKTDSEIIKVFDEINPKRNQNNIKKYVTVAIPIVIALILIYLFIIVPTGQNTTEDGVFAMNLTNVEVSNNNYAVYGESYNIPSDSTKYIMNIKFFDKNDNLIFEVNSTADEFKHGVMWQGDLPTDNITHVGFRLIDLNNNELSKQDYMIK